LSIFLSLKKRSFLPALFLTHLAIPSQLLETLRLDPVANPLWGSYFCFAHLGQLTLFFFLLNKTFLMLPLGEYFKGGIVL
jgi:hypothetical protein